MTNLLGAVLDEADHEARPLSAASSSSVSSGGVALHLRRAEPGTAAAPASVRERRLFSGDMCRIRNAMQLGA